MPLSEGATRARQARRLLQRVLEFTPDGVDLRTVVRIGRRAAEGIVELAAEEEADLIIFGWGGRPAGRPDARRRVQPDHRRGPPRRALRHRGGQAARHRRGAPDRGARPGRSARGARAALRGRARSQLRRRGGRAPRRPAGPRPAPAGPGRACARHPRAPAGWRARRGPVIEGTDVGAVILAEAAESELVVMGATRPPPRRGRLARSASCRRRWPRAARTHGHRGEDARGRPAARPSRSAPPRTRPWRPRSVPRPPGAACPPGSTAGSASRASTTASSPTCAGSWSSRRSRG